MSNSIPQFNVSTAAARSQALDLFDRYGWATPYTFLPWLYWKLGRWCWNNRSAGAQQEVDAQRKAAVDIIRAGKENGVDELEITMSEDAGLGFGSAIEGFPIEFKAGTSGKMTLRVKYK